MKKNEQNCFRVVQEQAGYKPFCYYLVVVKCPLFFALAHVVKACEKRFLSLSSLQI